MSSPGPAVPPSGSPSGGSPELDGRGSRRLTGREEWFWYLAAAITYIAAGMWQKFLLNWIIGPAWLVAFVVIGPAVWDRVRRAPSGRGDAR